MTYNVFGDVKPYTLTNFCVCIVMSGYVRLLELIVGQRLESCLPGYVELTAPRRAARPQADDRIRCRVRSDGNTPLSAVDRSSSFIVRPSVARCSGAAAASLRSSIVDVIELAPVTSLN